MKIIKYDCQLIKRYFRYLVFKKKLTFTHKNKKFGLANRD